MTTKLLREFNRFNLSVRQRQAAASSSSSSSSSLLAEMRTEKQRYNTHCCQK